MRGSFHHEHVAWITAVIGYPSNCGSPWVTDLTVGWVSQCTTIHSCWLADHCRLEHILQNRWATCRLQKPTLTSRCAPWPRPSRLAHAGGVSHQDVAFITGVGGYFSSCYVSSGINLAMCWGIQNTTVIHSYNQRGYWLNMRYLHNSMLLYFMDVKQLTADSLMQLGALPVHTPVAWHVRLLSPIRL